MDDTRRQALMAELEDAKAELGRLQAFVETLSLRLGVEIESVAGKPNGDQAGETQPPNGQLSDDPMSLVYPNEFVGMSLSKAAEEVLIRFSPSPHRRPLKTPVLTDAIRKGGLEVKTPSNLYRSLHKHSRFHSLGSGLWGLAEWYPDAVRKAKSAAGPTPPEQDERPDPPDTSSGTTEDDLRPEEAAS